MTVSANDPGAMSDQDLYDTVRSGLTSIGASQNLIDCVTEMARRWHSLTGTGSSAPMTTALVPTQTSGTLASSKVKLEAPSKFDGNPKALSNFLF